VRQCNQHQTARTKLGSQSIIHVA